MKIYVASSWRNVHQPKIVAQLRDRGHKVYDFRHPAANDHGFSWREIDPNWQSWDDREFQKALQQPIADRGFKFDMDALNTADAVVLVLPCGRSAHLELGYAVGRRKPTAILLHGPTEPELMYKMADCIACDETTLFNWLWQVAKYAS